MATFDMVSVKSSQISMVGYDELTKTMRVAFVRGAMYEYHPVEKSVYDALITSDSVGADFNKLVKTNSSISYRKI